LGIATSVGGMDERKQVIGQIVLFRRIKGLNGKKMVMDKRIPK
jgi:hypothetical protein